MTVSAQTIADALKCDNPRCQCQRQQGNKWLVHCPAHDDRNPSLSITEAEGKILFHCHAGCRQGAVIEVLREKGLGLTKKTESKTKMSPIEVIYEYHDEGGNLLFRVVRRKTKKFSQCRPDGKGGWVWDLTGITRVPYRLPEVLQAESIIIVEGEKDVETLRTFGLTATCNPGGAGNWPKYFKEYFQGKHVVILPDNDKPGRKHADDVAKNLYGTAASIKILELPGLPEKGDVSDWINQGGTPESLISLAAATPLWETNDGPEGGDEDTRYFVRDGALCYQKPTNQGPVDIPLCNFDSWITEEIVRDDGTEPKTSFKIQGKMQDGQPLMPVEVPASQFPGMAWVMPAWGVRAVINPGPILKDHLRAAMQLKSRDARKRQVYEHTGWRQINGVWVLMPTEK